MFGRLGVREKILAVVAVPILVLVLAAGAVTVSAARTWESARNVTQLLTVIGAATDLSEALQNERGDSANFVHAYAVTDTNRSRTENVVNAAYLDLRAAVANVGGGQQSVASADLARVDEIVGLRIVTNTITGVVSVQSWSEVPTDQRTGLSALRAVRLIENSGDWPTFPDDLAVADQAAGYQAIDESLTSVVATATTAGGVRDAIAALEVAVQDEAAKAHDANTVPGAMVPGLQESQTTTDVMSATFTVAVNRISDQPQNDLILVSTKNLVNALTLLPGERSQVRDRRLALGAVLDWYATLISPLVSLGGTVAEGITQRPLAHSLGAFSAVTEFIDAMLVEEIETEAVIREGRFTASLTQADLQATQTRTDVGLENAQAVIAQVPDAPTLPSYGASFDITTSTSFGTIRGALAKAQGVVNVTEESNWPALVQAELDRSYRPNQALLWQGAEDESRANTRSAQLQTVLTAIAAALVVAASFVIALLIARRIVRPLRRLTTTATAVRQELPRLVERVALPGQTVDVSEVQIPVESSDEVGRLAEAFNAVNAATLAIAGEQAALRGSISEMFVNVARRDQVLLNRQLASIDEMERAQDDPETLTRLFALDHLATRMRRNSESLLVLAGIDTGRRMRRSMPLSDVIRTASSEIELYERVQLELDADPEMVGHSALTAGHLFAELLENATVFSDPGTPVVVRTSSKGDSIVVEIIDQGIGMTPEELHEANARVMSTAASEILGAQRLGLFVVGRIARRLGAKVEIVSEEGKGATAIVSMPMSLFDTSAKPETDHGASSAVDTHLRVPVALIGHDASEEEMDEYSVDVMTPAITGAGRRATPVEEDEGPDIEALIQEDAETAPESAPVDIEELTEGRTAKGLPSRRRRSGGTAEAKPETGSVLGLPERPTSGQLEQLSASHGGDFVPGGGEETGIPKSAEQRSAMFRGFRARREDEGAQLEVDAESLGQAARRDAIAPDVEPSLAEQESESASEEPGSFEPDVGEGQGSETLPVAIEPEELAIEVPKVEESSEGAVPLDEPVGDDGPAWNASSSQGWGISAGFDHGTNDDAAAPSLGSSGEPVPDLEPSAPAEAEVEWTVAVDSAKVEDTAASVADESAPEVAGDVIPVVPSSFTWDAIPAGDEEETAGGGSEEGPAEDFVAEPFESVVEGGEDVSAEIPGEGRVEDLADGSDVVPVPFEQLATGAVPEVPTKEKAKKAPKVPKAPKAAKTPKAPKERRSLFGRKKGKEEEAPADLAPFAPPTTESLSTEAVAPDVQEAQAAPAQGWDVAIPPEATPATDEFGMGESVPTPQYDEWGLPISTEQGGVEGVEAEAPSVPMYDEWGLPVVESPSEGGDLDLPSEDVAPAPRIDLGIPDFDATPDLNVPPLTDEFSIPSTEDSVQPGLPVPSVSDEAPYVIDHSTPVPEVPPESGEPQLLPDLPLYGAELPGQPLSGEIPDLTVEPVSGEVELPPTSEPWQGGEPASPTVAEPIPSAPEPVGEVPSFDAVIGGGPDIPWTEDAPPTVAPEIPWAGGETPEISYPAYAAGTPFGSTPDQPYPGEVPHVLRPDEDAGSEIPGLEPEPVTPVEDVNLPDLPPPPMPTADFPPPAMPGNEAEAYGAQGYEGEAYGAQDYGAATYGAEAYGAAAQAYTMDEFAQPYGWETAGASALAATVDTGDGGYSPEAFVAPTAPPPPDGLEAEMASEVFSELSSLTTERPKVQRTRAGLQKRSRVPGATEPTPIPDIEPKPVARDAEAVRANFSNFHSATRGARGDVGDSPHIHGTPPDEVTP